MNKDRKLNEILSKNRFEKSGLGKIWDLHIKKFLCVIYKN